MSRKIILFSLSILLTKTLLAQVQQEWIATYRLGDGSFNMGYNIATDKTGLIYVTGNCYYNLDDYDIVTIKYNSTGQQIWVQRYDGPVNSDDWANAIAVDSLGNVYVTGYSDGGNSYFDYCTIKYNSSGVQQWVRIYNGTGNYDDRAYSISVDGNGTVYVTGASDDTTYVYDYVTIKYDTFGNQMWIARYNSASGGNPSDLARVLALDRLGNVYVTGYITDSLYNSEYCTIKYNNNGIQQWVARYEIGEAWDIKTDSSANVYVTGVANNDYTTIKYNTMGIQQWVATYNGPGYGFDRAQSISLDRFGNIFVYGMSFGNGTDLDFALVKYNSAGTQQWVARYNGTGGSTDFGTRMALDSLGNAYVTGHSWGIGSEFDWATLKYNSDGVQQWVMRYDGGGARDFAYRIVTDGLNAYVTGFTEDWYDRYFTTIKYSNVIGIVPINNSIPRKYGISQNFPNPFNITTKIRFELPKMSSTKLVIYDILGKEIETMIYGLLKAGSYEIELNAKQWNSGVYFCCLHADGNVVGIRKMVFLK